jgi:hypothetical protein
MGRQPKGIDVAGRRSKKPKAPEKKALPAPVVPADRVPLFPDYTLNQVRALGLSIVLGDDHVFEIPGVAPPSLTKDQLRAMLMDDILGDEVDGVPKSPGQLLVQITAMGVRGPKREPYDVAVRDMPLTADGTGEPPEPVVPPEPVSLPDDAEPAPAPLHVTTNAPPAALNMVREPRTAPRRPRTPREHVVIPDGASFMPGDIDGEVALQHMTARQLLSFIQTNAIENNRTMHDGVKMLTSAFGDGMRKVFAHSENRDERIQELKADNAQLRTDRNNDRAEYARKVGDLEQELLDEKRKLRKEITRLEKELDGAREGKAEAEKEASKEKETMQGMVIEVAKTFGPGILVKVAEKFGVPIPEQLRGIADPPKLPAGSA